MLSYIINIQFNFTTKAYRQDHWKKQYHKINTDLPWEKPNKKIFLNIDDQKIKDKTSDLSFSSLQIRLSLSLSCATQVCDCVFKWGVLHFYLYSSAHLTFHSTKSNPLNLTGPTSLGGLKTIHYYILEGANDLNYKGGVFLMTLYWPSTILMILPIGTLGTMKYKWFSR